MNYLKNPLPVCTCPAIVPYFRLVMFHDVWGNSKEIHVSYIPWQYKWADVWSTHHTIEPDWRVAIFCWIKKIRGNFSIHIPNEVNKWKKNVISKKKKKKLTSWLWLLRWNHLRTLYRSSSFWQPYRSIHAIFRDAQHQIDQIPIPQVASIPMDEFPICRATNRLSVALDGHMATILGDKPNRPNYGDDNLPNLVSIHSNAFPTDSIRSGYLV